VTNGLLLRADIHTLFDIGLIAIDEGFKVLISPNLDRTEYSALRGQVLSIPEDPAARPSVKALQWHREQTGL
jgi:predicted restriction endonuclease